MRETHDTLTLVGSGPLRQDLEAQCLEEGVAEAVSFAGSLDGDDLVAAYASAHTLVLPSTEEVWGLVVNEGLAAGLHAVVSDACGIAPSIAHMPGVMISRPTVDSIAEALTLSRTRWTGR